MVWGYVEFDNELSKKWAHPDEKGVECGRVAFGLGCRVGTLRTTYLDLKFAAIYNSMMVSNGIERKASEEGGNVETPFYIQEG